MPLEIVRNDITKMQTDAIVNAANSSLQMGGGVCGAIFRAAGARELQVACDRICHCPTGGAVETSAFHLQADYIIHTVGPVWRGGNEREEELLRSCYKNSVELAASLGCGSIAFPLISAGIYGYPKEQALQVAISEIDDFLLDHEMLVYIVVFDKQSFGISEKLYRSVKQFVDEHYIDEQEIRYPRNRKMMERDIMVDAVFGQLEQSISQSGLEEALKRMDEPFSVRLIRFIDEKNMSDVDTYKKANIDRKLFSKIRNSKNYTPMKKTVIAFAIALQLDLDETEELLESAGYTLTRSNKFDVIIEYFIKQENYRIHEINEALFAFGQPLLGA